MKKMIMILVIMMVLVFTVKETEVEAKGISELHMIESCGDFNNPTFVEVIYYNGGEYANVAMEGVYDDTPCSIAATVEDDGTLYIHEAIEGVDTYYCDYAR